MLFSLSAARRGRQTMMSDKVSCGCGLSLGLCFGGGISHQCLYTAGQAIPNPLQCKLVGRDPT